MVSQFRKPEFFSYNDTCFFKVGSNLPYGSGQEYFWVTNITFSITNIIYLRVEHEVVSLKMTFNPHPPRIHVLHDAMKTFYVNENLGKNYRLVQCGYGHNDP